MLTTQKVLAGARREPQSLVSGSHTSPAIFFSWVGFGYKRARKRAESSAFICAISHVLQGGQYQPGILPMFQLQLFARCPTSARMPGSISGPRPRMAKARNFCWLPARSSAGRNRPHGVAFHPFVRLGADSFHFPGRWHTVMGVVCQPLSHGLPASGTAPTAATIKTVLHRQLPG